MSVYMFIVKFESVDTVPGLKFQSTSLAINALD